MWGVVKTNPPRHYPKKAAHRSVIARHEAIWDYMIVYQAARLLRPSQRPWFDSPNGRRIIHLCATIIAFRKSKSFNCFFLRLYIIQELLIHDFYLQIFPVLVTPYPVIISRILSAQAVLALLLSCHLRVELLLLPGFLMARKGKAKAWLSHSKKFVTVCHAQQFGVGIYSKHLSFPRKRESRVSLIVYLVLSGFPISRE